MENSKFSHNNRLFLVIAAVICVIGGIALLLMFLPQEMRLSPRILIASAFLVFSSLVLGIICFWWYHSHQLLKNDLNDSANEISLTLPDVSEIFFQPTLATEWYRNNITSLKSKFADLERISHLLSYMDFSFELQRQINLALQFANEFFPNVVILVYLQNVSASPLLFVGGIKNKIGTVGSFINSDDVLVAQTLERIKSEVDLEILALQKWRSFSLPLRHLAEPQDLTILPLSVWNRILGFVVFIKPGYKALSADEIVLASLFNRQFAICIANRQLYAENMKNVRFAHEIKLARDVQKASFPSRLPLVPGFDLYASCVPCYEISGDYYDIIPLGTRVLVTVADVSGKGLPAALFLSKIQTLVRAMVDEIQSPAELLSIMSRQLSKEGMGSLFATMIVVVFEPQKRIAICASAGHCKPLVIRLGGGYVEEINLNAGIPLGLFEQEMDAYSEQTIDLFPGDGMFLYTDGVTDLTNSEHERFGVERLKAAIEDVTSSDAERLVYHVNGVMNHFRGDVPPEDDITMVYVKLEKTTYDRSRSV